jgi:hypothetical protein
MLESVVLPEKHSNMSVNVAVVKNLVAKKGPQLTVNFGEGGSEGGSEVLPGSGNTENKTCEKNVNVK